MLNCYSVKVKVTGHYVTESNSCPPEWRGSGCYDIEVPCQRTAGIEVWADSPASAVRFAADVDFDTDGYAVEIDEANVVSIAIVKPLPGADDEEAGIVDTCWLDEWDDNMDYADDAIIERGRERYYRDKYGY